MEIIILSLCSYIIGSIPFGLILTKYFLKKDVRKIGSGNIGATNVLRTGNKVLALLTLFFDVGKGYLVVKISFIYFPDLMYLIGLICFIGHLFVVQSRSAFLVEYLHPYQHNGCLSFLVDAREVGFLAF